MYLFVCLFSRGFKSRRMDNYNSDQSTVGSHNNDINNNHLHSQEKKEFAKPPFKQAVLEMPF